jgi:hypothetical protein
MDQKGKSPRKQREEKKMRQGIKFFLLVLKEEEEKLEIFAVEKILF